MHILALQKKTKYGDLFQFYNGDLANFKWYLIGGKGYWLMILHK